MPPLSEGETDGRNRTEWSGDDVPLLAVIRCSVGARHGNSFADKFRRPKHRSQCSILLIGVFVGGIRFNSRMRWVDISPEVSCAARNGWRLYPYPYPERRGRAKNLPNPLQLQSPPFPTLIPALSLSPFIFHSVYRVSKKRFRISTADSARQIQEEALISMPPEIYIFRVINDFNWSDWFYRFAGEQWTLSFLFSLVIIVL